MRCPFLREANVRYCRAAPLKKMIVHRPGQPSSERCSSPEYVRCPVARENTPKPGESCCPFLHECLVQYCAAASVTKYIPYSESGLSRCGNDSHRYCDLYLAVASGGGGAETAPDIIGHASAESVVGMQLPQNLWYSRNHLWLDMSPDGMVHIGIDAFLAAVLGEIHRVEFVDARGSCHPSVVMSVREADLPLTFPNRIDQVQPNGSLRSAPEKLTAHPYGSGWLFEGTSRTAWQANQPPPEARNLLFGAEARAWMKAELRRLTDMLQSADAGSSAEALPVLADGGMPTHLGELPRRALLRLFNEFFQLP